MNLVGKIFTVLILVMSILFMAFAISVYATHRNWKDLANETKSKVVSLTALNERLRGEIEQSQNQMSHEKAARRFALGRLESRLQEKSDEASELNRKSNELLAQQRNAIDAVNSAQRQLDQLNQQVAGLQQEILTSQQERDVSFEQVRELTDQIHEAKGIRNVLDQRLQQLTQDYTKATTVLKANDLTINSPVDNIPPAVEGEVVKVVGNNIEVSVGEHDGIKQGHTIVVSRRDKYLGRAEITRVGPDRAVGRIRYRNAPIQEGDRVQTKVEIR
ncbi:MAG: hypothetical protein GY768_25875 [Planctomycetaceae bacterium]|nr:hypothetical protein [Planctomycetaceae bacterium]